MFLLSRNPERPILLRQLNLPVLPFFRLFWPSGPPLTSQPSPPAFPQGKRREQCYWKYLHVIKTGTR